MSESPAVSFVKTTHFPSAEYDGAYSSVPCGASGRSLRPSASAITIESSCSRKRLKNTLCFAAAGGAKPVASTTRVVSRKRIMGAEYLMDGLAVGHGAPRGQ